MQAVILAAGRGSRLGPNGDGIPKCLLEVGRRPLIEHQLETLSEAGVGPVAMVVGYCADEIQERVGIKAEYLLNAQWSTTNSLYSFTQAREWVKGPVMVLNSDILLDPRIVDRLLAVKGDAIAYQSTSGHGREHMKVKVIDGFVRDMSKELAPEEVSGENVGILCLTEETARRVFDLGRKLTRNGGRKNWIGSAIREVCKTREIRAVDISDLPWGEIDFSYDLDRVRKEVWPAIERNIRNRRPLNRIIRWVGVAVLLLILVAGFASGWVFPQATAFDVVELHGAKAVRISVGDARQTWHALEDGDQVEADLGGPTAVKIDSRIVLDPEPASDTPYVLEITLDGQRTDWILHDSKPSSKARLDDRRLGKRKRVEMETPEGPHTLGARLIGSETGRVLVRVRQIEPDVE